MSPREHRRDTSVSERQRVPRCVCGSETLYDAAHDAYFCGRSGTWLEAMCTDERCSYCAKRPDDAPRPKKSKRQQQEGTR